MRENSDMKTFRTVADMREAIRAAQTDGRKIGLVPTMGALHEGHLSLIRRSAAECGYTVVSIFVNPIQFDERSDFDNYPHDLERDAQLAAEAGANAIFAPDASEMYPAGFSSFIDMTGVTEHLCGLTRDGHFRGVCTVVGKLFNITTPDFAYFGKKDAQQLAVVTKMAKELDFTVCVVPCPTVRESDGLAMSSRNARLSPGEREAAKCLYRSLVGIQKLFAAGEHSVSALEASLRTEIESEPLARIDYAQVVDPETFETPERAEAGCIAALAVWVGATRLIDNVTL